MISPFSFNLYSFYLFLSLLVFMPNKTKRRDRKSRSGGGVDAAFVSDHHAAGRGDVVSVPGDYRRKPLSFLLNQSPPRNFANGITWITDTWVSSDPISGAGSISEPNLAFQLNQCANSGNIIAMFDQYCIYAVHVSFTLAPVAITTQAVAYGQLYTAVDFDNINAISTVSAISQYSSMEFSEIIPGKSHERYVKPCVGAIVGASNASAVTTSPQRMWVNSASAAQPHYGLRVLIVGNTTTQTYNLDVVARFIVGCRNTI